MGGDDLDSVFSLPLVRWCEGEKNGLVAELPVIWPLCWHRFLCDNNYAKIGVIFRPAILAMDVGAADNRATRKSNVRRAHGTFCLPGLQGRGGLAN
jgi:hypothetical protein